MNPFETLDLAPLRKELALVCKKMIIIAKKPGAAKGYHFYEDSSAEYEALAKKRDALTREIVKLWNKKRFS
jgi:hypothetical protein